MRSRHLALIAGALLLLAVGVISARSQLRLRAAPPRENTKAPDSGARTAAERQRILELRDEFLRRAVVRPFLQKRAEVRQAADSPAQTAAGALVEPADSYGFRRSSCVDVMCSYLGELACTNEDDTLNIVRACAGNYSGDCLRAACRRVAHLECNSFSQAQRLALACSFNVSGACLQAGCELVEKLNCDDVFHVTRILDGCAGNLDDACVRDVCQRLGNLGCSTVSGFTQVAQACAGTY